LTSLIAIGRDAGEIMPETRKMYRLLMGACLLPASIMAWLSMPLPASADEGQEVARKLSASGEILPLEKIAKSALAIKPGRILDSDLERKGKAYVYEIDVLDARGQVWEVELDAKSGKLIKLESED